jgi:ribosomal protein S12 methylthiotransferase accessory factor
MIPFLKERGLTRLADLTGLNPCGIPVFNAIRPNPATPSVSHGKGLTREASMASACGEAIERYHAFNAPPPHFIASYRDLVRRGQAIPIERLPLARVSLFAQDLDEYWCLGWDIVGQREIAVPFSIATMARSPARLDTRSFQTSSNGFANGTHFLEAVYQGLLELVERDAVAILCQTAAVEGRALPGKKVDLDSVGLPIVAGLLNRLAAADLVVGLYDCSVDTDVPVYHCVLADRRSADGLLYTGSGASLDPGAAMARAITEAVQSISVLRSGVRDVTFRDEISFSALRPRNRLVRDLENAPGGGDAGKRRSEATGTLEDDIMRCLDKLAAVGIDQVIVFDLTLPEYAGAVVKLMAPGLEGYHGTANYAPGARALRYMKEAGK